VCDVMCCAVLCTGANDAALSVTEYTTCRDDTMSTVRPRQSQSQLEKCKRDDYCSSCLSSLSARDIVQSRAVESRAHTYMYVCTMLTSARALSPRRCGNDIVNFRLVDL